MNFRQKLIYTTYGALIAFIGMWFTSAIAPSVTAERETDIVCTSLRVVNEAGNTVVKLDADENGGGIIIRDETGAPGIALLQTEVGGGIAVYPDKKYGEEFGIVMSGGKRGGRVEVYDKTGRETVLLTHAEHGGVVGIATNGKPNIKMSGGKRGGRVEVLDKTGREMVVLTHAEHGGVVGIATTNGKLNTGGVIISKGKAGGKVEVFDKTGKSQAGSTYEKRIIETRITKSITGL